MAVTHIDNKIIFDYHIFCGVYFFVVVLEFIVY